jgi:solute carrier family 25 (adenine nucleotide translocator) protein 4/5/6/31
MAGKPEFNGFFDVIIKTIKTKGIGELYRGWVGLCFGTVIYRGIYFGMYDSIKPSLPSRVRNNLGANFLLGWFISVAASFATEPIDAVRRRMFIPPVKYKSYVECIRETVKKEGVASLFARFETNLHKRLAAGLTLALYDRLKL